MPEIATYDFDVTKNEECFENIPYLDAQANDKVYLLLKQFGNLKLMKRSASYGGSEKELVISNGVGYQIKLYESETDQLEVHESLGANYTIYRVNPENESIPIVRGTITVNPRQGESVPTYRIEQRAMLYVTGSEMPDASKYPEGTVVSKNGVLYIQTHGEWGGIGGGDAKIKGQLKDGSQVSYNLLDFTSAQACMDYLAANGGGKMTINGDLNLGANSLIMKDGVIIQSDFNIHSTNTTATILDDGVEAKCGFIGEGTITNSNGYNITKRVKLTNANSTLTGFAIIYEVYIHMHENGSLQKNKIIKNTTGIIPVPQPSTDNYRYINFGNVDLFDTSNTIEISISEPISSYVVSYPTKAGYIKRVGYGTTPQRIACEIHGLNGEDIGAAVGFAGLLKMKITP